MIQPKESFQQVSQCKCTSGNCGEFIFVVTWLACGVHIIIRVAGGFTDGSIMHSAGQKSAAAISRGEWGVFQLQCDTLPAGGGRGGGGGKYHSKTPTSVFCVQSTVEIDKALNPDAASIMLRTSCTVFLLRNKTAGLIRLCWFVWPGHQYWQSQSQFCKRKTSLQVECNVSVWTVQHKTPTRRRCFISDISWILGQQFFCVASLVDLIYIQYMHRVLSDLGYKLKYSIQIKLHFSLYSI